MSKEKGRRLEPEPPIGIYASLDEHLGSESGEMYSWRVHEYRNVPRRASGVGGGGRRHLGVGVKENAR